jgi:hypothetical protein
MDFVPGVSFSRVRRQLLAREMENRLLRTVQDFARFVDIPISITLSFLLIKEVDFSLQRGSIGQS